MIPIEQTDRSTLLFLKCGCAGWHLLAHPTGTAFLVKIIQQTCAAHAEGGPEHIWSVPKGELVSPFVRTLERTA
jgi:hypothetical protein